ncbi:MAG: hypothetical protein HQL28_07265 [Candidatus Omnitrophica bacterium]|nr:hypothetical protein [Candidatus Omnitrophota bacterium]
MKKTLVMLALLGMLVLPAYAITEMVYDFKDGTTSGWNVPDWQGDSKDYVTTAVSVGTDEAITGNALMVVGDFPGNKWRASCAEREFNMDMTGYSSISADIYLPKKAHTELLQARIILTVGPWYFVEMRSPVKLERGKWTTVKAKLDVNNKNETDYWRVKENDSPKGLLSNITRVRRVAIRIEYNASSEKNTGEPYNGPVYVSNITLK